MTNLFKRKYVQGDGLNADNIFHRLFNYLLLLVLTFLVIAPIMIVVNTSLKSGADYASSSVFALPRNLHFENYISAWNTGRMGTGFQNTFLLVVTSVTGSVLMGAMVAYIIGRFKFKARGLLLTLFILPTFIPSITTQIAIFTVIRSLGLYNTIFAGIILFLATDIIQLYIFLQFMDNIPYSLDESAKVDGASYFRIFISIILPLTTPAIATVAVLKTLFVYNELFIPMMYMPSSRLRTVTTALLQFSNDTSTRWDLLSAGVVLIMIPTLVLYLFTQRFIISGVTSGSIKG